MNSFSLREIQPQDDLKVEAVIRQCLIEFGADRPDTAWADPYLNRFSQVYDQPDRCYWVALDDAGAVVGGVGIGPLPGYPGICELQKMYCLPEVRGTGISHQLMDTALAFAAQHYRQVYLETMDVMAAAKKFYEKYGFRGTPKLGTATGHAGCDVCYIRDVG